MKNKKKVLNINLSNKLFYTLIAVIAVLLIGAGVYAAVSPGVSSDWRAGEIANPGHSIQDIAAPSGCADGQYLAYDIYGYGYGSWNCATPPTGSGLTCNDCQYSFEDLSPVPYGCDNPGEHLYFDSVGAYYGTWKCGGVPLTSVPSNYVRNVEIKGYHHFINAGPGGGTWSLTVPVSCPSGKKVLGGGCEPTINSQTFLIANHPQADQSGWLCVMGVTPEGEEIIRALDAWAICANID